MLQVALVQAAAWTNMTVYDVLPQDCRHTVTEKDVGNPAGDAYFNTKDKYLPVACAECAKDPLACRHDSAAFDCSNPESKGSLVVRKIEVEVSGLDERGGYALCNDDDGKCGYRCVVPSRHLPTAVGVEKVCAGCNMAPEPGTRYPHRMNFDYWDYNVAALLGDRGGGRWYSLRKEDEGKFWRNAKIVKVINAGCQATALDALVAKRGEGCFRSCPQPLNTSTTCWVDCFFETVLGKGHNTSVTPAGGMEPGDVTGAWLQGFNSDDPAEFGCPACPSDGDCPFRPPPGAPAAAAPLVEA